VQSDYFSVRWTGEVQTIFDGVHTFYLTTEGGVQLTVAGNEIINHWVLFLSLSFLFFYLYFLYIFLD
jgi:hypothetical protein